MDREDIEDLSLEKFIKREKKKSKFRKIIQMASVIKVNDDSNYNKMFLENFPKYKP